jgi:8-oxo-dGTP pyrophosphatase MutT (NUDIX family)
MSGSTAQIQEITDVFCTFENRPWLFASEAAAAIDAHWSKLTAQKPRLFNGRVLMMQRYALQQKAEGLFLEGACFEADYKAFISWRDFGFPDRAVWNCFAMPALRSADGAFILGEMAPSTASPGRIYFPAGTPEPGDIVGGSVDFEGNIQRELEEETGLSPSDVALHPGWTLVFAGARIACMKIVQSPLTAAAIVARVATFLQEEPEPELTRVVPVFSLDDLDEEHMPDFTLSYLRHVLGAGRMSLSRKS